MLIKVPQNDAQQGESVFISPNYDTDFCFRGSQNVYIPETPSVTPVPTCRKRTITDVIDNEDNDIESSKAAMARSTFNQIEENDSEESGVVKFQMDGHPVDIWSNHPDSDFRLHIKGNNFHFIYDTNSYHQKKLQVNWKGIDSSSLSSYIGLILTPSKFPSISQYKHNSKILKFEIIDFLADCIVRKKFTKMRKKEIEEKLNQIKKLFQIDFIEKYSYEVHLARKKAATKRNKYSTDRYAAIEEEKDHPNVAKLAKKAKTVECSRKNPLPIENICRGINNRLCLALHNIYLDEKEEACHSCLSQRFGRSPYDTANSGTKTYFVCMGTENFECRAWATKGVIMPAKEKGGVCYDCKQESDKLVYEKNHGCVDYYIKEKEIIWRGSNPDNPRNDIPNGLKKLNWLIDENCPEEMKNSRLQKAVQINKVEKFYLSDLDVCQVCESVDCLDIGIRKILNVSIVCCLKLWYRLRYSFPKNWNLVLTQENVLKLNKNPNYTTNPSFINQFNQILSQTNYENMIFLFSRSSNTSTPKNDHGNGHQRFMAAVKDGQSHAVRAHGSHTRTQYSKEFIKEWISQKRITKEELLDQTNRCLLTTD